MPGRSNIYCYASPIPVSLCCMSPFLTFACIPAIVKQISLTLQFCKIYDNQMASILGCLAVGKKWFIKVLFFPLLNLVVASLSHRTLLTSVGSSHIWWVDIAYISCKY